MIYAFPYVSILLQCCWLSDNVAGSLVMLLALLQCSKLPGTTPRYLTILLYGHQLCLLFLYLCISYIAMLMAIWQFSWQSDNGTGSLTMQLAFWQCFSDMAIPPTTIWLLYGHQKLLLHYYFHMHLLYCNVAGYLTMPLGQCKCCLLSWTTVGHLAMLYQSINATS